MKLSPPPVSLLQHVEAFDAGAHVVAAAWLGESPALALADGRMRIGGKDDAAHHAVHGDDGLLVAVAAADRFVSGGGDGRICATDASGGVVELAREGGASATGGPWIVAIAASPNGAVAWSVGRKVAVRDAKGAVSRFEAPTTAQGLAFAPKGYRLAVTHYNGVSLWFPNVQAPAQALEWKGSHLDVLWSADGRFVVTSMQENALHGWRISGAANDTPAHMRMSGYPGKTRSFSWSHDGVWLATSGADAVIIWPFQGDGPTGKAPRECGVRRARCTRVAFHPGAYVIAAGYDDGAVILIRMTDGSELVARAATRDSAVTALAWDGTGKRLLFGADDGQGGLLTLPT
jgi:WD40 repeat protein